MNQENRNYVTELVLFKLKEGVDINTFLQASADVSDMLKTDLPGFIDRSLEHTQDESMWVDIVRWESMDQALEAMKIVESKQEFQPFVSLIETKDVQMFHLKPAQIVN
jgi:hypothetical protein